MGCGSSVGIRRHRRSHSPVDSLALNGNKLTEPGNAQTISVRALATSSSGVKVLAAADSDSQFSTPERGVSRQNSGSPRELTILHFNDVYNIEAAQREPVGGAARLAWKVKSFADERPLVIFSGDCFSPSLMSTITMGKQMPPVLNSIGVHVACVGNHDLDFGVDSLVKLMGQCNFPWLMANVLDKETGEPLAGVDRTLLLDWQGVRVGVVGLVEKEWLETLALVDPQDITYLDAVTEGRRLARQLRERGAELLIAVTHMRVPNDRKLAAEVGEFDLVLGGHDHHYEVDYIQPYNNLMAKSGTDFRDLTRIKVLIDNNGLRPKCTWEHFEMTGQVPEDPEVAQIVKEFASLVGEKMEEVVGESAVDLDGCFASVRLKESNLGNLVADLWRGDTGVDVVLLNSGSLRSDRIHPAGPLTVRDWVEIHPMVDETVVLELNGLQLMRALENGVSKWPRLEGRFPQVSGLRFMFDPREPEGSRVVSDSVFIGNEPIDLLRKYTLATKEYLASGHDGYDVFKECKILVDGESGVVLANSIRNHWRKLEVLNALPHNPRDEMFKSASHWVAQHHHRPPIPTRQSMRWPKHFENPVDHSRICVRDRKTGRYVISPVLEHRIVNLHPEAK